jgi:hypothetical protein
MAGSMSTGALVVRPGMRFNGVKVFSATMADARANLGELINEWLATHPQCKPTEFVVTQSSDSRFHCVSVVVLFAE